MAAMGVFSRVEKIVGGSRRKIFRDHMPGVPGFRCFLRAIRRVHHREPVSEGRVRDHHDNVGYLVVLEAIEWLDVGRWWSLRLKRGK